jgi:hypothetical protein
VQCINGWSISICFRVQVLVSDCTIHQGSLEGVAGVWKPYGINSCWRVLKYEADGHFSPHFDAEYRVGPRKKSLRTFMVYLNDVADESGAHCCLHRVLVNSHCYTEAVAGYRHNLASFSKRLCSTNNQPTNWNSATIELS